MVALLPLDTDLLMCATWLVGIHLDYGSEGWPGVCYLYNRKTARHPANYVGYSQQS